ncbi:MAG: TetR/AcrR family transcriptional regulator [Deltaproteobacteria bacterium]|nr:TetR/AcrR family transcriptional regulator [Deltaproteobacteria bacterium]
MAKTIPTLKEQGLAQGTRSPRAEAIVADAIRLITEEGYGEFSLRKVAARNGIKLASLQYHFKTKEVLLNAVLDQVLREYEERFNEGDPDLYTSIAPEQLLEFTIDFLLVDNQLLDSTNFFFQLYAMSCHDASAAKVQEKIYALYRKTIGDLIQMVNPALSAAERNIRSIVIISMVDGLMLFISEGKSQRRHVSKIAKQVKKQALRIAMDK